MEDTTKLINVTGKAISGEWGVEDDDKSGVPILRTTNFTNEGKINYSNVITRKITKKNIGLKYLMKGDIIIEKSGGSDKQPVGRVVYFEGDNNTYLFNNFTGLLRVKNIEVWNPKYIFWSLYAAYRQGKTKLYQNKTTGLHNLKTDVYVKDMQIRNRTKNQQLKIVESLDKVQSISENYRQQLNKLDELIKARFVEMFGDPRCNNFKWKQTSIKESCTLKSGKSLSSNIEKERGDIPYIKVKDMNSSKNTPYITTSSKFVKIENVKKQILPAGTVIFPKRGGAIGTNKKRLTKVSICADLNIMGVIPNIEKLNSQYLFAYFNTIDLKTLNNGSSVPQINNKDIEPLSISLPPLSLQNEFANFVQQVDKSKVAVQKSLDETQKLYDSLMQEYFG